MGVRDDLDAISALCQRGIRVIDAAAQNITLLNQGDPNADTQVTLTAGQKQGILDRLAPILSNIKTKAAGLPGP